MQTGGAQEIAHHNRRCIGDNDVDAKVRGHMGNDAMAQGGDTRVALVLRKDACSS